MAQPSSSSAAPSTGESSSPSSSPSSTPPTSSPVSTPPTSTPPASSGAPPPGSSAPPPASSAAPSQPSIPPVTTSALPSSASQQQSSTSIAVITSGNVVQTQTVIIQPSVAPAPSTSQTQSPNKGFFDNKGAVAGTFTVVGLVVVAGVIFFVTMYLRRRRQDRYDRETDEAAFEAAAAPAPAFLDDDDYHTTHNVAPSIAGAGGGVATNYTGPSSGYYSDTSTHGTYAQQPMSPESYGMSELSHNGVGPGQLFSPPPGQDGYGGAAGAAGIGVTRTRSMMQQRNAPQGGSPGQSDNGYGLGEGNAPYPAFAGPSFGGNGPQAQPQQYADDNPYAAAGVSRGQSQRNGGGGGYNPYFDVPNPSGDLRQRSQSPPAQSELVNPHSPPVPDAMTAQQSRAMAGVTSQGSFGSVPEYGQAPLHIAQGLGQVGEQGRWSDYQTDEPEGEESGGREEDSDGEEEEERPKVFKVANE